MEPSDTLVPKLPVHNANTRSSRRKTKHEKLNACRSFANVQGVVRSVIRRESTPSAEITSYKPTVRKMMFLWTQAHSSVTTCGPLPKIGPNHLILATRPTVGNFWNCRMSCPGITRSAWRGVNWRGARFFGTNCRDVCDVHPAWIRRHS